MDSSQLTTTLFGSLFTLFTTLYCCIRPDLPCRHDSRLRILSTKLNMIFWVLICPEAIFYWAMRQWFEAGSVATQFPGHSWTRRHGLFFLMGGLVLCNSDGQPIKILSLPHFERLCHFEYISFPTLTSSEIRERSNFHPTVALIAFLQAIWFLVQCVSRINITLTDSGFRVITPWEAITATIVIVNWCIFGFAWKKPLGARFPFLIKLPANSSIPNRNHPRTERIRLEEMLKRQENLTVSQASNFGFHLEYPPSQTTVISQITRTLTPRFLISAFIWPIKSVCNDGLRLVPRAFYEPAEFPDGTLKIPLFFVQNTMFQRIFLLPVAFLSLGVSAVSLVFVIRSDSALHFLSQRAQLTWRIASITSTSISTLVLALVCVSNFLYFLAFLVDNCFSYTNNLKDLSEMCMCILVGILIIVLVPFLLARIVLLVVSVAGLSSMPSEAFVTRSWTKYIPHLS